jgi:hypothetical protein
MKIEFLDDLTAGGLYSQVASEQLVRLFDFDAIQAASFKESISEWMLRGCNSLNLSSLHFIEPVNCNLIFTISEKK